MRILVVSNLYPPEFVGGYELICQRVVDALRAHGHVVHVLTSDHSVEPGRKPAETAGVSRLFRLHGQLGHPWLPIPKLHKLEAHNTGVLLHAIREHHPDLVYCWGFGGLSKSLLFTLQNTRLPTVFCVCDHWIPRCADGDVWMRWWNASDVDRHVRIARRFFGWIGLRRYLRDQAPTNPIEDFRFRHIHFCSAFLRDFTFQAGFQVEHTSVIYCPVDIKWFDAQPKPAHLPLKRLLFAGRLHPDKGVLTALQAMVCLRGCFDGQLTICGRGEPDYEQELRALVRAEALPVDFCQTVPPDQMPAIYTGHDALLFTSEWEEPFALTPLEAMSCGLPVIGTTTGGSAELFRHRSNSLTYDAGNATQLANCIIELARDGQMRTRLAQTGREEVQSRYAEPVIVKQIEAFLEESRRS